uniref:ABC transporter, substrate binding protein, phosphate n=1 Tax=Paulinella chromatophora TaxID=39717 RepID=B1X4G6_PAUCH|nr:ABC transporter, substrate binding protein, phosphate [Paulinella chromatophora]ACB42835.1 ABC transporter, substrate binding protein, phosphate [Paulinella chromatophora]
MFRCHYEQVLQIKSGLISTLKIPTWQRLRKLTALTSLAGILISCCPQTTISISGAGASFPALIYDRWFYNLRTQGFKVNYQSTGSGTGIRQFIIGTVDFAASDTLIDKKKIKKITQGLIQVPMTSSAIGVAYNLPGCKLELTQIQLVKIFQGSIKNFKELNCKEQPITIVYRAESSGTTFNFTKNLSRISKSWKKSPGTGKTISWPIGIGSKGSEGVASTIEQMKGALGYSEMSHIRGKLQAASLENGSGKFIQPNSETVIQAIESVTSTKNLLGHEASPTVGYPIVAFTWIFLAKRNEDNKIDILKRVFSYMLSPKAQKQAVELGYVSLPIPILKQATQIVNSIGRNL